MKVLRDFGADMKSHPQLVNARDFVLAAPDHVPAICGRDREVLWSQGEGLLIVGPQGIGKTTVLQQLALRRAGVLDGELIGFPVEPDDRLTLYLALDRPQQIARSFKRMVSDAQEEQLGRLVIWKGPLPFNVVKEPEKLLLLVQDIGEMFGTSVGTVCADSLKDMAAPLSSDEVGAALNRAISGVIAQEIEFAGSHHQRKATGENKKPTTLADVYGSTWITAGAGSVVLLWGEPGDPIVEMTHLKQPADEIGPLELAHDHDRGSPHAETDSTLGQSFKARRRVEPQHSTSLRRSTASSPVVRRWRRLGGSSRSSSQTSTRNASTRNRRASRPCIGQSSEMAA